MEAFNEFSEYLSSMKDISTNLKEFASRTMDVDAIANQILATSKESKELTKFLTSHFDKIELSGKRLWRQ